MKAGHTQWVILWCLWVVPPPSPSKSRAQSTSFRAEHQILFYPKLSTAQPVTQWFHFGSCCCCFSTLHPGLFLYFVVEWRLGEQCEVQAFPCTCLFGHFFVCSGYVCSTLMTVELRGYCAMCANRCLCTSFFGRCGYNIRLRLRQWTRLPGEETIENSESWRKKKMWNGWRCRKKSVEQSLNW